MKRKPDGTIVLKTKDGKQRIHPANRHVRPITDRGRSKRGFLMFYCLLAMLPAEKGRGCSRRQSPKFIITAANTYLSSLGSPI